LTGRTVPSLQHLVALSDDTGVIQHAVDDVPNRSTGYCTDDVARAWIVALQKLAIDPGDAAADRLATIYLSYLHDAQLEDGRFHNFMSYDRTWLDAIGTHDSVGRAIWSLGYGMRYAPKPTWRRICKRLFDRSLQSLEWLGWLRSQAYAALGLAHACESTIADGELPAYRAALRHLATNLKAHYLETRGDDWHWFEDVMTYDNARLPEAMIRAGLAIHDDEFVGIGLQSHRFYEATTIEDGIYVPIGNDGWFHRGGHRARYAQQPLEAVALVDAAWAAFDATSDPRYRSSAQIGMNWYNGRNSRGIVMARDGGCLDGLEERGFNSNMGAESTLAYLSAAYTMAVRPANTLSVAR
jgi:hypothetical protein